MLTSIDFKIFKEVLTFLPHNTIVITSHELVDLDGAASAIALNFFLHSLVNDLTTHLYFSSISKNTKIFLERLNVKFPNLALKIVDSLKNIEADRYFIVDTNKLKNISQFLNLSADQKTENYFFFIDHHYYEEPSSSEPFTAQGLFKDEYSSTCEIIVDLFQEFKIELTKSLRYLLIAGIITDTGYFKYANNSTIHILAKLLKNDIDIQEIRLMLKIEPHISEKIAKIKGTQRNEMIKVNDWLIGLSHVSSFEAKVANALIRLGFDIAMVIAEKTDQFRISLRAKQKICRETGLHLGKLLEEIASKYNASGGGHDGAAAITIDKKVGSLREVILTQIEKVLA
ncbi:MAG: putative manganese-dependent inorganic pyrophosphatase [Promethearchaeota archaeon]|nr:MAG: putative manganese-dependent inorganic pyrophosphatase [Candidatus Lokiarchaeota archaeon]